MENEKKDKKILIFLIIFIVISVLSIGYIVYEKVTEDSSIKSGDVEKGNDGLENIELSDEDKKNINERLLSLETSIYSMTGIHYNDFLYDTNYLECELAKYILVWETMLLNKDLENVFLWNTDPYGTYDDSTGDVAIKTNVLAEYYKKILGEELDKEKILLSEKEKTPIREKIDFYGVQFLDDMTYGSYATAPYLTSFVLKTKELTYDSKTNTYTLLTDFLTTRDTEEENNALIEGGVEQYVDSNILDYPKDIVYSTIEIKFEKHDEGNIIKSFVAKK